MLVGCKADITATSGHGNRREVTYLDGRDKARTRNWRQYDFNECSSQNNVNVSAIFRKLADDVKMRRSSASDDGPLYDDFHNMHLPLVQLEDPEPRRDRKKKCCS